MVGGASRLPLGHLFFQTLPPSPPSWPLSHPNLLVTFPPTHNPPSRDVRRFSLYQRDASFALAQWSYAACFKFFSMASRGKLSFSYLT